MSSNMRTYTVADDFVVNGEETGLFTLETVTLNLLVDPGTTLTNLDLSFYKDSEDGGPGVQISSLENIEPQQIDILSENEEINDELWDVIKVTIALDDPIDFMGESAETVYWMGVYTPEYQGNGIGLELNSETNPINPIYKASGPAENWNPLVDADAVI